ncbi:uncharacterized protein RHIMIDRAFT_247042 [Rhizopus microsporus ATCC 52813]|uniref:C3H1-type domain-containing protein n=1 Tax=Rhizopus microsporus ATCC 52813 TaxID=1340429 RepID=A0A2G4T681_RHIZD|nr:uncharacterized protein RHIMIDRAFT_247042 [Rhizopus microsporus ATCC 52813]PHZ16522.1 hypothetical protein RHIMIDRAFT_247042 [Rhizopus microsporus ATCC 52813]
MVSKLASLLGDAPPSLEELKHISKSPSTTNVTAQSTKSAPIQNPDQDQTKTLIRQDQPITSAQQAQKDVKSDDNDLISSILEQVTTGVKSTFIPPQIPSAPAPSQQQFPMKRPSQEVIALTTPTKIQKKKRSRKNKKNKNKVIPEVVHRDTPKEEEDVDFDTEMDRYFQATTNAQKKQEEEKTEPISSHEQKDTSALKYSPKKRSMEEVAYEILGKPIKKLKQQQQQQKQKQAQLKKAPQPKKEFVPLVPCKYYAQGYCKDGDNCTFKHDNTNDPEDELCRFKHEGPRDIKICQFYKTQSCTKGDACPFSHDLKLEPCRFYHIQKVCEQGDKCPYSHETLTDESLQRLRQLTGPCRFWQFKGYCVTGDQCLFAHDDISEEERKKLESTITPCIYYHIKGECRSGDDCFYLHDEATPEQVAKLKSTQNK